MLGALAARASLGMAVAALLLPLYVVIATAFKPLHEIVTGSMLAPPSDWTTEPLRMAWSRACVGGTCEGLAGGLWNAARIAVPAACVSVMLGAVNGYALTKWRLPGAHVLFGLLLAANLLPYQMVLLPAAIVLRELGLFGTASGLVLVHIVYGMPYMTLLFRNFFLSVPQELVHAAQLDGARFWSTFFHVVLPLSGPVIAVAVALQFTAIWNDYLFGLVFGGQDAPVTVMLNTLINSRLGEKDYNVNMAGVLLTVLPPLAVYVAAGRWLLRGLTAAPAPR